MVRIVQQVLAFLGSNAVVLVIAVAVPWFTFRLALRQDRLRRMYDQRAELYVDLLTEAIAEQRYFEYDIADDDTRARIQTHQQDLRLPQFERARLGARANIFASREVNRLFNGVQSAALRATLIGRPKNEGERLVARLSVGKAFDALEDQVRRELGPDERRDWRYLHEQLGRSLRARRRRPIPDLPEPPSPSLGVAQAEDPPNVGN